MRNTASDLMNLDVVTKTLRDDCLRGRRAVVTGARSKSIGSAVALVLAKCGAEVAIHAESDAVVIETKADLAGFGVDCSAFVADFTKPESAAPLAAQIGKEFGAVDILINNCGWTLSEDYLNVSAEQLSGVLGINLIGPHLLTQALLPAMLKASKSNIVCLSSVHAHLASPKAIHYAMTKAAILAWVRGLAAAFGPSGLTAHAVSPGWVQVDRHFSDPALAQKMQDAAQSQPTRRIARPAEVAGLIAFLCTDLAQYANGSEVLFDGGRIKQLP